MAYVETRMDGKTLYQGRIVTLQVDQVRLPNGKTGTREVVRHPGGVCVAAVTPQGQLLLVRQFRYAVGRSMLELPAGKLEPGEDPFEAMKREQMEETGTTAEHYRCLGDMIPTPGYCDEVVRLWACRITGESGTQHLDPDEFVDVERMDLAQAEQLVLENRIADAKTQVGILKTALLVRRGEL